MYFIFFVEHIEFNFMGNMLLILRCFIFNVFLQEVSHSKVLQNQKKMSTRCCAFNFCTNNATKITKWKKQMCEIHQIQHGLGSCICDPPFQLFPFPTELKDKYGRQKWTSIINRKNGSENWMPKDDSRVCSDHFIDGRPTPTNPYPTLKLGYTPHKPIVSRPPPKERTLQPTKEKRRRIEQQPSPIPTCAKEESNNFINVQPSCSCDNEGKIALLEAKIKDLEIKLDAKPKEKPAPLNRFSLSKVLKSDAKVKFYTGFPNLASFNTVYQTIHPHIHKTALLEGSKKGL